MQNSWMGVRVGYMHIINNVRGLDLRGHFGGDIGGGRNRGYSYHPQFDRRSTGLLLMLVHLTRDRHLVT